MLLVIGYWLLVIGYWLLVIGYWLLVIGYWLLVGFLEKLSIEPRDIDTEFRLRLTNNIFDLACAQNISCFSCLQK
jgi:hypothetical protein